MDQNIKKKSTSGVITFIFYFYPVVQYHIFNNHTPDAYYIFNWSNFTYGFLELFFTGSRIPLIIQSIFWILTWWGLYKVAILYSERNKS